MIAAPTNSLHPLPARRDFVARDGKRIPSLPVRGRRGAGFSALFWVQAYIYFQFACQVALLIPALGAARILFRSAAFGASLALLLLLPRAKNRLHPASKAGLWVVGIIGLSLFHPAGNSVVAGLAQVALYVAILAPLYWVARARIDAAGYRRIILIFWAFYTLSATVGVLQAYFPGRFQPPVSTAVAAQGDDYVDSLKITLANGQSVFRPMGLSDQPGGAAMAGLYAVLFGLGLVCVERRLLMQGLAVAGMGAGFFCLYLAQVRSVLVMTLICVVAFCIMLGLRRDFGRLLRTLLLLGVVIGGSFLWAVSLGGKAVTGRLWTLIEDRPDEVYNQNRGYFLQETLKLDLPRYPLGAGLGRWGMVNTYFGHLGGLDDDSIWVEIQWTGWLLDGGVPLILAYVAALGLAFWMAWKIALDRRGGELGVWGALILAYNLAAFAVTFNYPLFIGQGGLEFWLLNAALFGAYQCVKQTAVAPVAAVVPVGPMRLRRWMQKPAWTEHPLKAQSLMEQSR